MIPQPPPSCTRFTAARHFPPTGKLSFDMRERDEPSLFPLPAEVDIERLEAIVHLNA